MLGRYYATIRAYEKAEKFFIRGKLPMEVIKMYISAGKIYNTIIESVEKMKNLFCIRSLEQGI
jgi:hypothetical protein